MPRLKPTRLLALAGILLVCFLYWKPLHTYMSTKHELESRRAEVRALHAEKAKLERQVAAASSPDQLAQEARRLGLIKQGERLFIVKGIAGWRKHH